MIVQQLLGNYVREPTESDWHIGSISLRGSQLYWTNKARISWRLYLDRTNPNNINTGPDNPYYAKYPHIRRLTLLGQKGRITGFLFGGSTYHRQGTGASASNCAGDPLGSLRLLAGFQHQRLQGIDSVVGAIQKPGSLRIGYEIGRVYPPGQPRTGGSFTDRPKQTPPTQLRWYAEQTVNGQPVHIAYRRDNILLVSFPKLGMNMSATIRTPDEMAEAMLIMLSYGGPPCR